MSSVLVVAIALLLGTGGAFEAIVVLVVFGIVAVAVALIQHGCGPDRGLYSLIKRGSETTAQTTVRLVVLLLVGLGVLAIVFDLDVVLGAFAAGFVLRRTLPKATNRWNTSWTGWPSACSFRSSSSPRAWRSIPVRWPPEPMALIAFVVLILIVRGGPIFLGSLLERDPLAARGPSPDPTACASRSRCDRPAESSSQSLPSP